MRQFLYVFFIFISLTFCYAQNEKSDKGNDKSYVNWPKWFNKSIEYLNGELGDLDLGKANITKKVNEEIGVINNQIKIKKWKNKPWYVEFKVNDEDLLNALIVLSEGVGGPSEIEDGVAQWNLGRGISFVIGQNDSLNSVNKDSFSLPLIAYQEGKVWGSGGRIYIIKRQTDLMALNDKKPTLEGGFNPDFQIILSPRELQQASSSGTGFIVSKSGHIVTSYHVVNGKDRIYVSIDGRNFTKADLVAKNREEDIAILKIAGNNFRNLGIRESKSVRLGENVSTIGYPNTAVQGLSQKYTKGHINSLSGIRDDNDHFQISVPIQPGNSGGPLLDDEGRVVGIISARLNDMSTYRNTGTIPQNVNYAIKSDLLIDLLNDIGVSISDKSKGGAGIDSLSPAVVMITASN